jgi:hypothetical protein
MPGRRRSRAVDRVRGAARAGVERPDPARGLAIGTSIGLITNSLFWMVLALSGLTVWMLLGTWRHVRRRTQIQNALVHETNFRRAWRTPC